MKGGSLKRRQTKLEWPDPKRRRVNGGEEQCSAPSASTSRPPRNLISVAAAASRAGSNDSDSMERKPAVKLQIKNLKSTRTLAPDFEQKTWQKLQSAIHAIHSKARVEDSLETLYRGAEQLCLHKMDAKLYERLKEECSKHAEHIRTELSRVGGSEQTFLSAVDRSWTDFCEQQKFIRSIFLYLDRKYVLQTKGVASIWDMGVAFFGDVVIGDDDIRSRLVAAMLSTIESERGGTVVDKILLRNIVRMLETLSLYEVFEKAFLEASTEFYVNEGYSKIDEVETPLYLEHCAARLKEEEERVRFYLCSSTEQQLLNIVKSQLIAMHAPTVLERGFKSMMDENRLDCISLLFVLLDKVNLLAPLSERWQSYILAEGDAIANQPQRDATMVKDLLELKKKCDTLLRNAFRDTEMFKDAMIAAYEVFMNKRPSKPPELIAKFVDRQLRSGNRECTDAELDHLLGEVMVLFRFVRGKDIFHAFYRKDLAKRLLLGKSASIDMERLMIAKLKEECGPQFTSKFEGMFKDIDLSKELMVSFKNSKMGQRVPRDIDMCVNVLTTGFWPPYAPSDVKLPADMTSYQEIFKEFYLEKYNGRQLVFQHSLGHCILKADYPKGRRELCVSLFQAVVLFQFNDADQLLYTDIRDRTNIEEKELRRTLQSLACGKINKLLIKSPKGREVKDTDKFEINKKFTSKLFRLKVNSIQIKETAEEQQKTHDDVHQDRQYLVDAAIVRIMKSRKSLKHALLMAELISLLKFQLETSVAKKRIESLIEREYLERDSKDRTLYHYLA